MAAPPDNALRDGRVARAIVLSFFAFYLISTGRHALQADERIMSEMAESLVQRGSLAVPTLWRPLSRRGQDGRVYAQYALFCGLVHVPGELVASALVRWSGLPRRAIAPITVRLAPAFFGALTCALFFLLCRRLGVSIRVASWVTVALGLGTPLWLYARYSYSEAPQAAVFLGLLLAVLRAGTAPSRQRAIWVGVWAGVLLNLKLFYGLALLGAALYLAGRWRRDKRELARLAGFGVLGMLPFIVLMGWYNHARFGSPLMTGYPSLAALSQGADPLMALWGFLVSPGRGLLIFAPPVALSLLALPRFVRAHRHVAIALGATIVPVVFGYTCLRIWHGGWAWGPRYLTFALAPLLLPLAVLLDAPMPQTRRRVSRAAFTLLFLLGFGITAIGNAIYWTHHLVIVNRARTQWLGAPNTAGSPRIGDGTSFSRMYHHVWLPPFSPISGHAWLLRNKLAGNKWRVAQRSAPWRRYTTLDFDDKGYYNAATIDWWPVLWYSEPPTHRHAGFIVLFVLGVALALGARGWSRGVHAPDNSHRCTRDAKS